MNKSQVSCAGIYEYRETETSKPVFVNVFEQDKDIFVYFPDKRQYKLLFDVPETADFSKWI